MAVDSNVWQFLADKWCEQGNQLITLDLRGHGLSDGVPTTAYRFAQDLINACTQLEIEPDAIFAQSFGTLVLLHMLQHAHQRWPNCDIYAITPVWTARSIGLRHAHSLLVRHFKFLFQLGRNAGFSSRHQKCRRNHVEFAGHGDNHFPRFVAEARAIGWYQYARMLMQMWQSRRQVPVWQALKQTKLHIIGAEQEGLWDNKELQAVAKLTDWPLHWLPMQHVTLSTEMIGAELLTQLIEQQQAPKRG